MNIIIFWQGRSDKDDYNIVYADANELTSDLIQQACDAIPDKQRTSKTVVLGLLD